MLGGSKGVEWTPIRAIRPESVGAYIDTGFVVQDNLVMFSGEFTVPNVNEVLFGCSTMSALSANAKKDGYFFGQSWARDRWLGFTLGGSYIFNSDTTSGSLFNDLGKHTHVHEINIDVSNHPLDSDIVGVYSIDDTSVVCNIGWTSDGKIVDCPNLSQYVFARNLNGTPDSFCKCEVSRLTYSRNGVTLADFRAAKVGEEYGLYDVVSGKFKGASNGRIIDADGDADNPSDNAIYRYDIDWDYYESYNTGEVIGSYTGSRDDGYVEITLNDDYGGHSISMNYNSEYGYWDFWHSGDGYVYEWNSNTFCLYDYNYGYELYFGFGD